MISKEDFRKEADPIIGWVDGYLNSIEEYPVKSGVSPGEIYAKIPAEMPLEGEEMEKIMEDFENILLPGITHWQHPNFHAYFPANSSVESLLGEILTAAVGAQCMIWESSPAAAELEQRMMEWLREALGLPSAFEGVIQDSASSATLAALLSARERCTGFRANLDGVPAGLRVYCSTEAHSSVEKAVGICGIGRNNLVKIPVDDKGAMQAGLLDEQIRKDLGAGLKPCAVVAALGTTGTVAVDPLQEIAGICSAHGVWLHVDAAYAGSALLLPSCRWMANGMEHADSFVFNPHKWLFTNFDASAYFVRDVETLIRTFEILPEYLKTSTRGRVNDYRDWGVPLGRRFRALKLWFVLRSYGKKALREKLEEHIALNRYFCHELEKTGYIEFLSEPFLNFSCFRYRSPKMKPGEELDELNQKLLMDLNQRGRVFLTHTRVKGAYGLRMIIGQTYVEKRHVDLALEEIITRIKELENS